MPEPNTELSPALCRLFLAVVDGGGSLAAAAAALGEKVPALSKKLKPLHAGPRGGLPRAWLAKRGRRFRLTGEGEAVAAEARAALTAWDGFVAFAGRRREDGLVVACGQEAAGGPVLAGAAAVRAAFPAAGFRVAVVRGRRRIEGVAGGQYDVALVTHTRDEITLLARRPLAITDVRSEDLGLACGPAPHPWAERFRAASGEVTADDLTGWPLVLPEADSPIRRQFEGKLRRAGGTPAVALEVGGWRVLLGYVAAGFGVGLCPEATAREFAPAVRWRPLHRTLRPGNVLRAVSLADPEHPDLVAAFVSALR